MKRSGSWLVYCLIFLMWGLSLPSVSSARGRIAGLRISTSEVLDCFEQLKFIDILDEPQFAAVLRANFAKSRREQFHFDRLYHLFFHELRQEDTISQGEPLADQIQNALESLFPEDNAGTDGQPVREFLGGVPLVSGKKGNPLGEYKIRIPSLSGWWASSPWNSRPQKSEVDLV